MALQRSEVDGGDRAFEAEDRAVVPGKPLTPTLGEGGL